MNENIIRKRKNEMLNIYKLLGNETRLEILILLESRSFSVNELAKKLQISQSRVSHQLSVLKQHQLISYAKDGKMNLYKLNDPHILNVVHSTQEHVDHVIKSKTHFEDEM